MWQQLALDIFKVYHICDGFRVSAGPALRKISFWQAWARHGGPGGSFLAKCGPERPFSPLHKP